MNIPALLPYQQRWMADKSQVKLFTKSRRIGISWAEAADCALYAARADGGNCTYICYDKDITRQFIRDCADWARAYSLAAGQIEERLEVFRDGDEDKAVLVFRIYFDSGHEIEAIAGTARKLRGRKGRVVVDEAAFLDDLGEVLKAALALLIWGGDLHLITTYNGVDNPYYELEQDVLTGKLPYSRHFCTFEQAVGEGLYRRICLVNNWPWSLEAEANFVAETRALYGAAADEELDCIPSSGGGRYLPLAIIERAMAPRQGKVATYACEPDFVLLPAQERIAITDAWLREEVEPLLELLDPKLRTYYGMDFARVVDLSVIAPLQVTETLGRVVPFGLELRRVPFDQQKQILWWLIARLPRFSGGANDAGGNGADIAETTAQKFGMQLIAQIKLSRPWYAENFPRLKAAIEDDLYQLPPSAGWQDDLRLVELNKGVPMIPDNRTNDGDGQKRHGDGAIALVLAEFATRNESPPIEFKSAGRNASAAAWGGAPESRPGLSGLFRRRPKRRGGFQ